MSFHKQCSKYASGVYSGKGYKRWIKKVRKIMYLIGPAERQTTKQTLKGFRIEEIYLERDDTLHLIIRAKSGGFQDRMFVPDTVVRSDKPVKEARKIARLARLQELYIRYASQREKVEHLKKELSKATEELHQMGQDPDIIMAITANTTITREQVAARLG